MTPDTIQQSDGLTERIWQSADHLDPTGWDPTVSPLLDKSTAVVLFMVGPGTQGPELILTRRSERVKQPGDLCCPGGGIAPRLDPWLARLLQIPGSPLRQWRHWPELARQRPDTADALRLALATALREAVEENRLWPLGIRMLMPLPPQTLVMFQKAIRPIACWVGQQRFFPNWEVARVVRLPICRLMKSAGYARLELTLVADNRRATDIRQFPCFRFASDSGVELLWGVTYRIVMDFLRLIFDFRPPDPAGTPLVSMTRGPSYLTGNGRANSPHG